MARAIWSGAINFGLVSVPVKLFTAVKPKDIAFHQVDEKTGARIRYKRVSEKTGREVPYEKIAKGYEIGDDKYVVIEPKELEKLTLQNRPPIVLVSPQIRAALRQMTQPHLPQLVVLSYNEVTRDTAIESVAMVVDGKT